MGTEPPKPTRAWLGASISEFLKMPCEDVIGRLTAHSEFAVLPTQRDAWMVQREILAIALQGIDGSVFLEFSIPRMGRRIDAVLLIGPVVFAIEFKVGEALFDRAAIEQVWDYALDLKNFHEGSHAAPIVPVLVATEAAAPRLVRLVADHDSVFRPVEVGSDGLRAVVQAEPPNRRSPSHVTHVQSSSSPCT